MCAMKRSSRYFLRRQVGSISSNNPERLQALRFEEGGVLECVGLVGRSEGNGGVCASWGFGF